MAVQIETIMDNIVKEFDKLLDKAGPLENKQTLINMLWEAMAKALASEMDVY